MKCVIYMKDIDIVIQLISSCKFWKQHDPKYLLNKDYIKINPVK